MRALLLAIPLLPLVAAVAVLCLGRRLPRGGGELVVGAVGLDLVALVPLHGAEARVSGRWFTAGGFELTVGLEADPLGWFAAVVVAATALGVGTYALGYMAEEPDRPRFFAGLGLFVGAMLALVLADSLVLLFGAWELVGLASYLLIGFHYAEARAARAAAKAFLMTRIGDVGLLLGWLLALGAAGATDIATVLAAAQAGAWGPALTTLVALLCLAGPIGKSAQLPLTAWLPDAMAGPTPVSALLHSATMVAAGVFLVLRLYPLYEAAPAALAAIFWIGAATALFSGLVATSETDLKRVLAWSTSSQLGEMMMAAGLGGPVAAAFHLATHAAFKATLFLGAGAVQERTGTLDLNRLGGLLRSMPVTGLVFTAAALALAGVPPLSGFWSEEAILAAAVRNGPAPAILLCLLILLAGVYAGRATVATFLGPRKPGPEKPERPTAAMLVGMVALALPAVALGWFLSGRLGALLPWDEGPEAGAAWRFAAVGASFAGLAVGGAAAARGQAKPALGSAPERLAQALFAATEAAARAVLQAAAWIEAAERRLDAAAQVTARVARSLAQGSEAAEARGFGRGGDRLAEGLALTGERLRALQSGKLYLYTLGLFAWALAAVLAGGLAGVVTP